MASLLPTTQEICEIVTEELALVGGIISETVENGERLFLRSLLPGRMRCSRRISSRVESQ